MRLDTSNAELRPVGIVRNATTVRTSPCEDCGKPIEAARLRYYPNSTRCLSCQSAHDEPLIAVERPVEQAEDVPDFEIRRAMRGRVPNPARILWEVRA